MADERIQLFDRAHALLNEIRQLRLDAEHWNRLHPDEQPIVADPDGELAILDDALVALLRAEGPPRA